MATQRKKRTQPVPGHKCMGAKMSFQVECECGWKSCHHYGPGCRKEALAEWRWHAVKAHKEAAT